MQPHPAVRRLKRTATQGCFSAGKKLARQHSSVAQVDCGLALSKSRVPEVRSLHYENNNADLLCGAARGCVALVTAATNLGGGAAEKRETRKAAGEKKKERRRIGKGVRTAEEGEEGRSRETPPKVCCGEDCCVLISREISDCNRDGVNASWTTARTKQRVLLPAISKPRTEWAAVFLKAGTVFRIKGNVSK